MEIFQKYKNIGLEKHSINIQNITIPLVIVGRKNVLEIRNRILVK